MTAVVTWGVGKNDTPTLVPSWGYGIADAGFSPPIGDATQGRLLARGDDVIMIPSGDPNIFEPDDIPVMEPDDDTLMWARDEDDQIFEPAGDPVLMTAAPDVPTMVVEEEPTVFFPDEEEGTVFEPEADSVVLVVPEDPSLGDPDE